MNNYIVWHNENEENEIIVEVLNEGLEEMLKVEKIFIKANYVITSVDGMYIKMTKVEEDTFSNYSTDDTLPNFIVKEK